MEYGGAKVKVSPRKSFKVARILGMEKCRVQEFPGPCLNLELQTSFAGRSGTLRGVPLHPSWSCQMFLAVTAEICSTP